MQNDLADEDPKRQSLSRHPVHGHGWVDADGYWNVNNYRHPFIPARWAPPAMWPINASDWGFVEWLPSQNDMTPRSGDPQHPAVVMVGGEEEIGLARSGVNAAFYYTYVIGMSGILISDLTGFLSIQDAVVDHAGSLIGVSIQTRRKSSSINAGAVEG